jgi:phospholipase C
MSLKDVASHALQCVRIGLAAIAMFQFTLGASVTGAAPQQNSNGSNTVTPIKHVIVIIGENRSYDHVFATYVPKNGQFTWNLLSEGIINADGTPGPNFLASEQRAAVDQVPDAFLLDPPKVSFPDKVLPAPLTGGPNKALSYVPGNSLSLAESSENGLPSSYYPLLITGGTTTPNQTPDTRIFDVNSLPPGPFQLTNPSGTFTYDDYAASPVHRFYQMWQQLDCSMAHATFDNPSGCDAKLFPWVEVTVGAGTNGLPQSPDFSTEYAPSPTTTTGEGSTAMGFYNVQQGDVPYFKYLADNYAMSDNFHQSVDGGTGANHIMFGHADMIWFSDGNGHPEKPPHDTTADNIDEIENPNPAGGTNNWYTEDGYGSFTSTGTPYGGGSYTNCSDVTQPGVRQILTYLESLPRPINPNCDVNHYYLLNNYNPGYFGQGENAFTDTNSLNTPFTIPPSSTPSIGDDMLAHNVSWKYYGDQWNEYAGNAALGIPEDKYQQNYGAMGPLTDEYCNICNPFQYDTSIMANAAIRTAHIQDTANLYSDIQNGTLPAVSIVKPSGLVDGHPASSKLELFEGFCQKIIQMVQANQDLWSSTAIFITEDEGGGYYDSGYVQPLDYFGDGTRIIFLVVSPFSTGGYISHDYTDHVSIDKFIERNWNLPPISNRSRDNDPDPTTDGFNPYVPTNSPAIGDLFDFFNFDQAGNGGGNGNHQGH